MFAWGKRLLPLWLGALCLVGCARAGFVPPPQPPSPPSVKYQPEPIVEPKIAERYTEKFVFKKASGEIQLGIVVQVHPLHQDRILKRLRALARSLRFADFKLSESVLSDVERIRIALVLEKESALRDADSAWGTFYPKTQKISQLRSLVESQIDSLQLKLEETATEQYPLTPFDSLKRVVDSTVSDNASGPSAMHILYLRDRDLFTTETSRKAGSKPFLDALRSFPRGQNLASFSLLSFGEEASKACNTVSTDWGTYVAETFVSLGAFSGELCDFGRSQLQPILNLIVQSQGRLFVSRKASRESIEVTVNGEEVRKFDFSYDAAAGEVMLAPGTAKTGDLIEVTYELAN